MGFNKISRRFVLFTVMAFSSFLQISAGGLENRKDSQFVPADIYLHVSNKVVEISQGSVVLYLPKVEKKIIHREWDYNLDISPIISMQNRFSFEHIQEANQLSDELGIEVDSQYLDLYREVANWLGTRYKWAGSTHKGIDCSGFTNVVYRTVFNKIIDRNSSSQAKHLRKTVDKEDLKPGNLVFFATNRRNRSKINHVGIYLGQGYFVHAARTGVRVSELSEDYYASRYVKGGEI